MCECAHIRRDKMKNTRTTQQTKIKKCMRWTASGLLLAVLFVLVFAGTLSGAFGIEKIADAGSPIDVSSISVSGTNIGNAFNTNNDSNKSKFYLSGNGDIASHFGYNTSANGGWGFTDWDARSNNPQVYWLEFKFSGDALTAVRQGRVSYYASAKGDFSDGTNDEYGMAISYMGDHSAPQAGWVDGSGEKWKTTNNLVEYQGFSNDNSKTFTFGQIGSFAEKYAISTTATGIRLIFAAIPDGNIDGGFKEINFTLYMKPNDTVSSTGTTFDVSDGFYGENYKISANSTSNWSNLSQNGGGINESGKKEYAGSRTLTVGDGDHDYNFPINTSNNGVAITYMSKPDKYSYTGSIDVSIVIPAYTTSVSISADVYTSTTAHRSRIGLGDYYVPKNDSTATVSILHSDNQVFPNTAKSVSSAMAKQEKNDDSNNKCGFAVVEHLAYSSTITTDASDKTKTIKVRLTLNASKEDQSGWTDWQFAFALLTNLQISFKGQYFVELNPNTSPNAVNRQTFVYGTNKSLPTRSELGWTNGDNTFTGWGTVSDGVVKYANGYNTVNGEFTNKPGATIKLYAIWVGSDFSHYDDRAADSTWGSKNNPFLITSDEEWKNLIDIVNGARDPVNSVTGTYYETAHSTAASDTKFSNCYFVLTSNLGSQDEPIGLTSIGLNTSNYFAGNIRGGNGGNFNNTNTVRVLYIDIYQESDYCGLFGYAKNASISFLEVSGAIDANDDYVGGILGYGDNVSVSNCKNDIDITSVTYDDLNNPTYYNYIGGIAGYLVNGAISNCANSGSIGGASNVGGIVGSAQASVSYCANIGGVITGNDYVGGIVGTSTSTVDHCYDVAGRRSVRQANGRIGAITGSGGTVTDSWAINEVARTGQTTTNVSTAHRTVSASTFNVSPLLNLSDTTNGAWTDIITQNIDGFKISGITTNGTYLYLNNGSNSIVSPDKMDGDTAVNSITNTAITKTSGIGFALYYGANKNSNINAELRDISTSISNLTYDGKLHSATNISLPTGYDPIANFYFVRDNNGNPTGNPTDDGRTNAGNYYVISEARFAVSGTTYVVGRKVISNNWVISKRAITLKQTHFEYFYGENVTAKAEYNNVVNGHIVKMTTPYVNFYAGIDSNLGYKDYVVTSTDVKIYIDGTDTDVSKNYSIAEAKITIRINEGDFGVQGTDDIAHNPWGSVNNPYLIRTQTQLERLAQIVASGDARNSVRTADFPYVKAQVQQNKQDFANCYFVISANIGSASAPVSLTPIGRNATNCFAGTIYGAGNSIKIIYLNINQGGESNVGLFGYTNGASISYIKTDGSIVGGESTGGIVGCAEYTEIFNCTNNAEINGKSETGGIIGYTDNSAIQNCTNNGVVKGADNVGGIVGKICAGTISACENTKEVTAVSAIGGIVGFATSLTINGATNSGTITGTGGQVAGIVGYSDANGRMYGVVKNSGAINGGGMVGGIGGEYHGYWCDPSNNYGSFENSGAINGGSGSAIGGITGFADKEILSAVNKGNVIGGSAVGGIAGRCQAPVKNSYNEANIQGTVAINPGTTEVSDNPKGVYVGGIVGYTSAAATILHCYNTGNIKACNADGTYLGSSNYVGGIVGFAQADVSYFANIRGIIEGNDYIGGIVGKSTSTINYCYDVEGQRILRYVSGRIGAITGDAGTVDYSWAVNEKTYSANLNSTATPNPTISTRGHWLTTAFAITPLVIDNGSYNEKVWTDILTQDINGFKVVGSVAANNFFVTDNGKDVSDSNYKYVKPLTTEGFTGDIGSVTVRYSATTDSDIRAHAEAITLPTASTVYNGSEQGFGYTTYPNTQSGATANTPIVYTSLFKYTGQTHHGSSPIQVDVYNVTVTIKIGDQIVGKTSATYTITPCEITITWTWTQYATANNGLSAEFEYNALAQGLESVDLAGYHGQFNVTGSDEQIIPAGDYSRTYTLKDARNYVIKNNNSNTITFRWKINAYNIKLHLENGEVWFGGSADLIVGNQLTSKVNGNGVDYYPLQVDVKGTSGVQQVLVYAQNPSDTSQKLYTASHFVLYVKYNDGTVTKINQGTDYVFGTLNNDNGTVGAFKEDLVSNTNPVVDTNVTARGKVNFTGDITRYYTALYSDFGGNVTSAGWGSSTNNPYVIDRSEYLLRLSQIVNGGMAWNSVNNSEQCYAPQTNATATDRSYAGAYFKLVLGEEYKVWDDADHTKFHYTLDMSDYVSTDGITNFLPIGRIDTSPAREFPFSGTFDGGWTEDHKNVIDYIYNIDSDSFKNNNGIRKDYIGLFGYTDGATITNFTLNCTSGEISGNDYVGFVVGYAKNSTIFDVKCEYGKKVNGNDYVGGVAGKAEGTTIECSKGNRVYNGSVQGREYVGGIVGMWIVTKAEQIGGSTSGQASITPVGRSEVDGFRYVGGLVGYLDASGCDLLQFKPSFDNGTYKENNVTYNNLTVQGTEYVGALFGVLIGNGYHKEVGETISTAIIIDAKKVNKDETVPCVHNVNLNIVNYGDGDNIVAPKVVGGLIGYIESAGLIFNTSYYTSSIKFNFDDTTPSVLGGVVGILGKNATIENCTVQKPNGTDLISGNYTITNDVAFGSASKAFGTFVGGIAGFVSSQAGTAYETSTVGTTYIFGNALHIVNAAEIYATGFAGGLFGAMGNVNSTDDVNSTLLSGIGGDTDLFAVLTTGVRKYDTDTPGTNLGVAPSVKSPFVKSAAGKMQNSALIVSVTDSYVGGLIGYVGDKVTLTLTNKELSTTLEDLSIFSGSSSSIVSVQGNYAGGLVGYLSASAHRFEYIAVQAQIGKDGAQYVGGLVGYMANGTIEHCVATNNKTTYNYKIDNFKGADFVGGLVGYVLSATINNSFTSGFNFASTSGTKGGIIGAGQQPNISSSWTIYIAKSGAKYASASKNQYGKYISFDDDIDKYNDVDSITEAVFKFAGFGGATTTLDFKVKVPNKNSDNTSENKQLVFYDASGDDEVTKNTFSGYENGTITNNNDVLTFSLDAENGTSMQVYVKDIEFVNIPKCQATDDDSAKKATVQNSYRRPSNSDRYCVEVGTAEFDPSNQQVTHIAATVYFNGVTVGTATKDNSKIAGNFESTFIPGSKDNPYTISTQAEWNDFAYSVYTGTTYAGKYFKLLTDDVVIDTGNNGNHEGTKSSNGSTVTYNFGTVQTIPEAGTSAPLTDANGNAIARNNIGYNFAGDISHDSDTNNFKGTFDGNGHYINIQYTSGGFYRVSVFPNAANATFRNLTIKGKIQAASQETGANGIANSAAYDVAGFVGKPFGALEFYNCTNDADIIGLRNVAGIVGYNAGGYGIKLEACVNTGNITSLQGSYTLGGYNNSKYNYDDNLDETGVGITNIGYTFGTGGIIGAYTGTIQIESCRNAGTIIGGHNVGGIIGLHEGTSSSVSTLTINNCANSGEIRSNSGYWGEDEGQIGGDASRGVRQSTFGYAGGLVGKTGRYSILKMYSSYNSGWVVTLSNIAGGLVGSVGTMNQPNGNKNSVLTGGRSVIAYCYNVGKVNSGGTFPKRTKNYEGAGRENFGGAIVGGVAGLVGNIQITQTYNAGEVWQFGIICYGGSWQVRAAGIVGQSQPTSNGYVLFDNVYNVGTVYVRAINTQVLWGVGGELFKDARYGAAISGYCDTTNAAKRIYSFDCYSINNCVSSLIAKDLSGDNNYLPYKNGTNSWESTEKFDEYYQNGGIAGFGASNADLIETGMVYNTYDSLTAAMNSQSKLYMNGSNFAFSQSNAVFDLNFNSNLGTYTTVAAINSVSANAVTGTTNINVSAASWARYPDSWLYVYGCLPQLSVFALDTQNGLSMRSVGYGKDIYGDYNEEGKIAGATAQYPYIIKDGIDLMGMQALVDTGYSFENKYIEVANGTNNLEGLASKRIKLATYDNPDTAATNDASNTMYKAFDENGNYKVGKSYHLLLKGAVFNKARNEDATYVGTDYSNWAWSTYYYNGGYRDNEWTDSGSNPNKFYNYGGMRQLGIFKVQNFIPMGRGSSVFKGHFSGKQANGGNTTIDDVRITTGKYGTTTEEYGSEYGGLFAKVQDAYIGYISIGGSSKIWSFTKEDDISACGGIVGLALGDTVIDNCGIGDTTEGDTTEIGAYGISKTNEYVILDEGKIVGNIANGNFAKDTYAGGIVGLADPKQGNTYNAGITTTIRNCTISTSGRIESARSNIGGIVGYIGGDVGANGKGNTVRIENCAVIGAKLQAVAGSEDSHHIGGIIGYGSSYVPAYITGCEVGQVTDKSVNINGEYALGGIAGAMSNAVGGFIDSCSVGAGTTITRKAFYGSNIANNKVSEDGKYGTAIGGLVGYTEAYTTKQVTTTFSGENTFAGTIDVDVPTTSPATTEAFIANIGGIVGDMGDGANFASGSIVVVSGTINVNKSEVDTNKAMNIGGVAGRTNTATFIGTFDVHPTMTSPLAQNVGGFIGKNAGATYVLADISRATDTTLKGTTITIGSSDGNGNYSGSISAASNVGGIIGLNSAGSVFGIGSNNVDGTNYNKGTLHITIYATITGSGNNVGGIVGLNESNTTQKEYGVVSIVRGVIVQNGAIRGASYVGGIVGYDNGVLETGGATADSSFDNIAEDGSVIDDNNIGKVTSRSDLIKQLSITNNGNVKGCGEYNTNDDGKQVYVESNYVGGFIGRIDEPRENTDDNTVDIAGTFTNAGSVEGDNYVGGLIGYVGKGVTIGTKNDVSTEFKNSGKVDGKGNYIGGSIGLLLGTIKGASPSALVKFENLGNVDGKAYVGGSIGVIAGNVKYAQFINKSDNLEVKSADTAVGGSVGYLGVPDTLTTLGDLSISVQNSHFEANGTLTVSGTHTAKDNESDTSWGGVGGAIGVIGNNVTTWSGNTYYARGNVTAGGINNVGGIIGLIKADNITISNMLAYGTTVSGATNVGGIVGATTGANTKIVSAYAIEGNFTGTVKGGIIGHAQTDTVANTSYWVKGYANEEIAGYDVEHLDNLGFTTGTASTGWFFLYAKDATGAEGSNLGKINTKHSTTVLKNNNSGAEQVSNTQTDDAELKYWKRIADAYTASERANGDDDNAKNPLTSTIVKGFGAPQKGTLYATATAALVSSNGYYMYVATSGKVRPTIEYGNVDNTTLGYLISVNTVKNGGSATTADDTTEQSVDTAGNVAVFYRKITKGEDLVYNGYYRNPIIGLDDVGSYNGVITLDNNGEATVSDYAEKYIYTATTITKDSDNNVETVFDKPSDPGTYTPTIKIFYVDASGKARLVGGHLGLAWTIKTRELTATFSSESQRTYGDKQDEEGSVDKTITITNIAPNFGKTVPIQVTVSAGEESTTFTWKGSAATKTENGITLTFDALSAGEPLSEKDKSATSAEDLASDSNTYTLVCKIFFKEAKSYSIVVSDGSSQDNKVERYTIKDGTGTFTVNKATLTFQRVSGKPASSAFDGTAKTTEWQVTGFKYNDGEAELAAFEPQFNLQYKNASSASSVNLYSGDKLQDGGINGPTISIGVTAGTKVNFALSSAVKKGEYWISFGKSEAGNYKFEDYDSLKFNIVEVQITVSCSPSNGSKTYDKQAATITITFVASVPSNSGVTDFTGIDNYEQFIVKYFQITDEGSNAKFTVDKPNGTGKKATVSWTITTGVNADTYTFTPELIKGPNGETKKEFEENCSWSLGDSTYQYKIKQRQLTLTTTQTGTSPYTYTYDTYHHGLNEVSLDSQNGEKGLISGDTVIIAISGSVTKPLTFTSGGSQSAGISTIDADAYTANFALTGNGNYTLSSSSIKSMSWTINQYEVKIANIGLSGSSRPYDGTATTPTITITGVSGSNGTYTYNQDTFTIVYSITKDGTTLANGDKLKNAGRYEIKVGNGNGSIKAYRTNSSSTDTSNNYKFSNTDSIATYEITPLSISIEWNYPTPLEPLVYTGNNQMISIKSITLSDANNTTSKTLEMSSNSVDSGCGNDRLTFTLSGGGTDAGSGHTTTATLSSVIGNTGGIDSGLENYVLDDTATSKKFTIAKSKLKIEYASGTADKVYDATTDIVGNPSFTFTTSSTNVGHPGSSKLFNIGYKYKDKNAGQNKEIVFTYTYGGNNNYQFVGDDEVIVPTASEIKKATFIVLLNKLRNGKATRTFTADEWYGGKAGATNGENSGRSNVYRSGEGFQLTEFPSAEDAGVITVKAYYIEAGNKRSLFDSYVNNVYCYKISEKELIYALDTTKHYKALVFTMEGDGKDNYTFNVCDSSKNAYNSTAGDSTTSVTVYDSDDNDTTHKNANGSSNISIEITVKTYKVTYANTAQSYANADNTYNTDWQRVVASNVPDGVTVTVSNGWMFADGKDHSDSEQAEKRQYTGYTTIRGSQNSVILGAKISGQNGMELNYKMSNQPILTIGYFVAQGDEFEIGSAASLMIASYYWTIAQNKDNPDFNQELVAGSTWHTVVSNYDYINTTYTKPADAPKDIPDNLESWDDYFAAFEKITGKNIFLNETGVSGEDGNWGYYEETETPSDISYTKFKLVRNFSGVLTESDIATLNAFFRVYNKDTKQYVSVKWGYGGTHIANFLKSSVSSTLTALGSVFMSVENAATPCEFDGNGYVIEYLNIMGYGKSNVGFFDIVGSNSVVKNLHLRNVTINANQGNVGGIAGSVLAAAEAASESSIANVSFHGTINVDVSTTNPTNGVVGGLVGNSARAIDGAIVLGTITANGAASVGGVVGVTTASISNVVSLMQVTAYSGTVGAFTATQNATVENSVHMTNAVWLKGTGFVNVADESKSKSYTELMNGSISGYGTSNKYYYAGETPSTKGTYDVLADVKLISSNAIGADNPANARESMRLKDLVYVYLLMYSLTEDTASLTESTGSTEGSTGFTVKVYKLSPSSWLVGNADGTSAKPVAIANKQNVSLLRQLPFATFTLKTNVTVSISNTFAGAFFGTVESAKNDGVSLGYKITCNNAMFEAYAGYAGGTPSWLTT